MLAWMIYVIAVSLLLGLAALAFEQSARLRKRPTRWLWGTAVVASLLLPFVISSVSLQLPRMTAIVDRATPDKVIVLRQMTVTGLSPAVWLGDGGRELVNSAALDRTLRLVWLVMSIALLLVLTASGAHLLWRQRRWERGRVVGIPVYLSDDAGPAIVGLFNPKIVVPRWLQNSPPFEQELVIAHEQAHLDAHDAQLLTIALGLLVCMPWNVPLWWQLRRLRFAIEIDCDARVLRRGHDVVRYGEVLIAVGERQSTRIAVVAAMSESTSFLEQRITIMLRKTTKRAWATTAALTVLGMGLAAGAAEISPPNTGSPAAGDTAQAHQEVAVDASILDSYVGFYQLSDRSVLAVRRDGERLVTQLTGQRELPIYAESKTEFFAKVVAARLSFVTDAGGAATAVILHQRGDTTLPRIEAAAAQQIADRTAEKVKSQSADPRTETALRRLIDGIVSGKPNYEEMSPVLAEATRQQLPNLQPGQVQLGAVQSVQFLGVGKQGQDVYNVHYENGISHWQIALDAKGIIVAAMVTPGP